SAQYGERTRAGEFKNKKNRQSRDGWFSFDMKVLKGQPMGLVVDYWGGFPGSRTFDILIDGELLATENISDRNNGQFMDVSYEIPEEMTYDKQKITVKFLAHEGHSAGPVFGIRIIKR
ncbi:unnamed protein product, partial [marine sediment metagenome]